MALVVLPLSGGFALSFTNYDGLNLGSLKFLGSKNYTRIFQDADAMYSFRRVLLWTALNVPLWLCSSFVLAYILNQSVNGRGAFRTLYYLPSVIPLVAVAWIGRIMLHQNFGAVNQSLRIFFPDLTINWLTEYAMISLTTIAVWTGLGSGIVIFLAGLQGIPTSLEEAAVIDGASKLQSFRHVTIPLMTPLIFYQLVLSLVTAMQYFALADAAGAERGRQYGRAGDAAYTLGLSVHDPRLSSGVRFSALRLLAGADLVPGRGRAALHGDPVLDRAEVGAL